MSFLHISQTPRVSTPRYLYFVLLYYCIFVFLYFLYFCILIFLYFFFLYCIHVFVFVYLNLHTQLLIEPTAASSWRSMIKTFLASQDCPRIKCENLQSYWVRAILWNSIFGDKSSGGKICQQEYNINVWSEIFLDNFPITN